MLRVLAADGPHPEYAEAMMTFGRLIGSWDLEGVAHPSGAPARTFTGEWHFGWVLEGRAVQDVLITRTSAGEEGSSHAGREAIGSTLRTYDPRTDTWWVVWACQADAEFSTLIARADGDRIVLEGQWTVGSQWRGSHGDVRFRWIFSRIAEDSFHWYGEVSEDSGQTWRLAEEMHARRRLPSTADLARP